MTGNDLMPAVFFGHGNPMNAVLNNRYSQAWEKLGRELPKPKAILCVSAHWYTARVMVTAADKPVTIHDFGGFPKKLYDVDYPAPGSKKIARKAAELLTGYKCRMDDEWGLDHGTWSVLCRVFPEADVPVVQLSIDATKPAKAHFEIGKKLAPLREEGVMIIGSGNIVHNLHAYAWGGQSTAPDKQGIIFERKVKEMIESGREEQLAGYIDFGESALYAAPTPDHYLPLLYVMGARHSTDKVSYPVEGFDGGSISMLAVRVG